MKDMLPGAILILDGTYVHIQKSSDFEIQKRTWCTYKMDNIVKMMVAITGNGRCFMAYGPYLSDHSNSDMYILNMLCDTNIHHHEMSPLVNTFIPGEDKFLVDRGFTQCDTPFELYHPTVKKGTTQFSSRDSNESHLTTFNRNTIERFFGRLQNWKLFEHRLNNHYLPKCGGLYRILCATDNRFTPPLVTETEQRHRDTVKILQNLNIENDILNTLELTGWRSCSEDYALHLMPYGTLDQLRVV